jgi:hypothetical protein
MSLRVCEGRGNSLSSTHRTCRCHATSKRGADEQNTRIAARTTVQRWSIGNTGFCGGVSEGVCTLKRAPQVFADVTVDACLW